jgi:hypothetical protein
MRPILQLLSIATALALAACTSSKSVDSGTTWTVDKTTDLGSLTIAPGAQVVAPEGKSLTLSVDGTETPIAPGTFSGKVVLSVTDQFPVKFEGMGASMVHLFRQALYLDDKGVVDSKSAEAAAGSYSYQSGVLSGVVIKSVGENFNGIVATAGTQTVKGATIDLKGNGGNDFAGFGAAILSIGAGTTLIVDGAKIHTQGVVRTGAIADKGSHLIVKNSDIEVHDGTLPAGYVSNVSPGKMFDVPWMLGLAGNARATNLLGDGTQATYINSSISSERWGVLSVDNGTNTKLTTIDSKVRNLGDSGYGSYAIGHSINTFLGTSFDVADYAVIVTGGDAIFAASSPDVDAQANTDLQLGLSDAELKALPSQQSSVKSARFGVMWHGNGAVTIKDGTTFDSQQTSFLDKGAVATVNIDGANGARVTPGNGVLVQIIDDDDPGPVGDNGVMVNNGVYHEPKDTPKKARDFDVTKVNATDVVVNLANLKQSGDLYNAARGGGGSPLNAASPMAVAGAAPAPGAAAAAPGGGGAPGAGPPGGAHASGKNLVVNLDNTQLSGVITASSAKHAKDTIGAADYKLLGQVTNTAAPVINNGVIVTLKNSTWTVTGKSYLSVLTLDAGSNLAAPAGSKLSLTVDGAAKPIAAGTYKGQIVLQLTKG